MNKENDRFPAINQIWSHEFIKLSPTFYNNHINGSRNSVLIKDSWEEYNDSIEGMFLREATEKKVEHVARYLHHETLSDLPRNIPIDALSTRISPVEKPANMFLRRVITKDVGDPIFAARTVKWFLRGIEGGIQGCMSLYNKAGIIHGNICIRNILINDKANQHSLPVFLTGLDCSIRRGSSSFSAKKPTIKTFRSINALQGLNHSFMDDMESFFWVIFWTIVHVVAPSEKISCLIFDHWEKLEDAQLAQEKLDSIAREDFEEFMNALATPMYKSLVPYLVQMRELVFPDNKPWSFEDDELPSKMKELTRKYLLQ